MVGVNILKSTRPQCCSHLFYSNPGSSMPAHLEEARAEHLKRKAGWQGSHRLGGPISAWAPGLADGEKDPVDGGRPRTNSSAPPHFLPLSL